jgi:1-deoxy-D-xylulose-5-phosphate synthase
MLAVPGMTIAAPHNADELIGRAEGWRWRGSTALRHPHPARQRPRAAAADRGGSSRWCTVAGRTLRSGKDVAILAGGTMVAPAMAAAEIAAARGDLGHGGQRPLREAADEGTLERLFPPTRTC